MIYERVAATWDERTKWMKQVINCWNQWLYLTCPCHPYVFYILNVKIKYTYRKQHRTSSLLYINGYLRQFIRCWTMIRLYHFYCIFTRWDHFEHCLHFLLWNLRWSDVSATYDIYAIYVTPTNNICNICSDTCSWWPLLTATLAATAVVSAGIFVWPAPGNSHGSIWLVKSSISEKNKTITYMHPIRLQIYGVCMCVMTVVSEHICPWTF